MRFSETAAELVRLGTAFYGRGWMLGTSGNLSSVISRDPLRLAITASSIDKGRMNADQILEVDGDGTLVSGSGGKPSAETLVHLQVVQSTKASAVLHTHSIWSTVLSDTFHLSGGIAIQGYEMLKGLAGVHTHEHREWIPILENTQDMNALARATREMLDQNTNVHGFLVRRHGMYTWGKDLASAARHVEILEFLLEATGRGNWKENN